MRNVSVTIIAGSKQKLTKALHEIVRGRHSTVVTCSERDLQTSENCKVVVLENVFDLPSVLSHIDDVDVIVVDIYGIIRGIRSSHSYQLARRVNEKVFTWLYAFSKAKGIDVYIMSPLSVTNNKPLVEAPSHLVVSKVKLL